MNSLNKNKTKDFDTLKEKLKNQPDDKVINQLPSEMDDFEKLILVEELRIAAIHCHKELDLMLVVLNNKHTIKVPLSDFKRLHNATKGQLNNWELIADKTGVHWPDLDEDLSLKGFLRFEFARNLGAKKDFQSKE